MPRLAHVKTPPLRRRAQGRILRGFLFPALLAFALPVWPQSNEQAQEVFNRAVADFQQGRIRESVSGFNRLTELVPSYAPQLWQRGIALYYAGQYKECREQFEAHRKVNPDDVENSAWHFLCVARAESPETAKEALLPVGLDPRLPMIEIYQMFRGGTSPERVLAAAGDQPQAQFFAHLYIGLYREALGDKDGARKHISLAAHERYAVGGYMHTVAKVHSNLLKARR